MLDATYYAKVDEILSHYPLEQRSLIPVMQAIQDEYAYLPPELLSYTAKKLGITEARAYSVASFYENFSFEEKGKYIIKVCDGTACHIRKSTAILDALHKQLGLTDGKHTTVILPKIKLPLSIASGLSVEVLMHTAGNG